MNLIDAKKLAAEIDGQMPELDLHLSSADNFEYEIDAFLSRCLADNEPRAKIITGIGSGVLNERVKTILKNYDFVVETVDAPGAVIAVF
ncbi:MAG: Smr/MutS family protein [Methanoregula sp.]|jgi:dsDNA-specific endonuclease/ATPase MutS2|nr:Smr/MutS family protein [Methanoregula sp.]